MMFGNVFSGKKVLITGNTGFKGAWLSSWLLLCDADVYGYSLDIPSKPSMFETLDLAGMVKHHFGDTRNREELNAYIQKVKPDFIFHLAAQAIVSTSYFQPFDTITTNVIGTASVLEALKNMESNCVAVFITSDKAYDNVEWIWGYRENDALGGKDVYSGSKGAAELVIKSYWHSFLKAKPNIKLGVARAGNVIGGGDWSADRIIVDCIKAFTTGQSVEIRSPKATRPWQHVLEPLSGYLCLAQNLYEGEVQRGEAFNFGPNAELTKTVLQLVRDLADQWGLDVNKVVKVTGEVPFEEAKLLKLNCDKALAYLNWHATLQYEQTVSLIVEWYKAFYEKKNRNMYAFTIDQINYYLAEAQKQALNWTT
nr:CDP-glucose 4,6-dehydratase [uncultured Bacteroides sp.]